MRIAAPCSEDLPSMPRVPGGVHCARCDRDVLDLRSVPKKRALAILSEKRRSEGRVCAWVRATESGVPAFASEPSRMARLVGPALVATALAACTPESAHHASTPITLAHASTGDDNANAQTDAALFAPAKVPSPSPIQPASNLGPVIMITTAGEMSF